MNEHIEKVRAAVDAHREQHTQGEISVGGIFNPDSADPRQNLWSVNRPDGAQSGELIAERIRPVNARRLCAAWNATLGFPTAALEDKGFIGSINGACEARKDLTDALTDALEFIEDQEDADCVDGRFIGNAAMNLAQQIREALAKHTPKVRS